MKAVAFALCHMISLIPAVSVGQNKNHGTRGALNTDRLAVPTATPAPGTPVRIRLAPGTTAATRTGRLGRLATDLCVLTTQRGQALEAFVEPPGALLDLIEDSSNAMSFSIYLTHETYDAYNTPVDSKWPWSARPSDCRGPGNNRLAVLSFDGQSFNYLTSCEAGFNASAGTPADAPCNLAVAHTGNNRVVVLDAQGEFQAEFTAPYDGYTGTFRAGSRSKRMAT